MSQSLWHRYPQKELNALLRKLDELQLSDDEFLDRTNREKISLLAEEIKESYKTKTDTGLDFKFFILSLEFSLLRESKDNDTVYAFIKKLYSRAHAQGII